MLGDFSFDYDYTPQRDMFATPSDPDNLIGSNQGKYLIQSLNNLFSGKYNTLGCTINPGISYMLNVLTYGFEIEFPKSFSGYVKIIIITRKLFNVGGAMNILQPIIFGDIEPQYELHGYTGLPNTIGGPQPNWYQNTAHQTSDETNSILMCTIRNDATSNIIPNRLFIYGDQSYTYDVQTFVEIHTYQKLPTEFGFNQYYRGGSTTVTYNAKDI